MARGFSQHQKNIIKNYYKNLDTIALQKLQESVSELYICESEKKQAGLWKKAETQLKKLDIKPAQLKYIIEEKDLRELARCISKLV
ncbi:hypothetical protein L21SP3_01355 [Sedimentisphaera cyanobacteriorum]|uniref:Uncharacterized protein n=1 Tax=Sedimentisphaera cyanobacteriorum TaxID=1940790 RepID=A0A1Q2HQ02_9BACT|nr:hypothetical protein [Sedimentisphaera cyanobacteriorum]AQQ09549.1 hypothetical protein L21SP3_01355 [Sedimentisphaera cyanobacteriorum]